MLSLKFSSHHIQKVRTETKPALFLVATIALCLGVAVPIQAQDSLDEAPHRRLEGPDQKSLEAFKNMSPGQMETFKKLLESFQQKRKQSSEQQQTPPEFDKVRENQGDKGDTRRRQLQEAIRNLIDREKDRGLSKDTSETNNGNGKNNSPEASGLGEKNESGELVFEDWDEEESPREVSPEPINDKAEIGPFKNPEEAKQFLDQLDPKVAEQAKKLMKSLQDSNSAKAGASNSQFERLEKLTKDPEFKKFMSNVSDFFETNGEGSNGEESGAFSWLKDKSFPSELLEGASRHSALDSIIEEAQVDDRLRSVMKAVNDWNKKEENKTLDQKSESSSSEDSNSDSAQGDTSDNGENQANRSSQGITGLSENPILPSNIFADFKFPKIPAFSGFGPINGPLPDMAVGVPSPGLGSAGVIFLLLGIFVLILWLGQGSSTSQSLLSFANGLFQTKLKAAHFPTSSKNLEDDNELVLAVLHLNRCIEPRRILDSRQLRHRFSASLPNHSRDIDKLMNDFDQIFYDRERSKMTEQTMITYRQVLKQLAQQVS